MRAVGFTEFSAQVADLEQKSLRASVSVDPDQLYRYCASGQVTRPIRQRKIVTLRNEF